MLRYRCLVAAAEQVDKEAECEASVSPEVFTSYMHQLLQPPQPVAPEVAWINIIAGRLLYDFLHNPYWANKVIFN